MVTLTFVIPQYGEISTDPFVSISTNLLYSPLRILTRLNIPSCKRGSPPVSVTLPVSLFETNSAIFRGVSSEKGTSSSFAHLVSQYAQARLQPLNRTKQANSPALFPSPFRLINFSTTCITSPHMRQSWSVSRTPQPSLPDNSLLICQKNIWQNSLPSV